MWMFVVISLEAILDVKVYRAYLASHRTELQKLKFTSQCVLKQQGVSLIFYRTIHTLRCSDVNSMAHYDSSDKSNRNKYEHTDKSREDTLETSKETNDKSSEETTTMPMALGASIAVTKSGINRRYWLVSSNVELAANEHREEHEPLEKEDNDKDSNLKSKIATLVEQTLHDTERKLRSLHRLKDKHKEEAPYKVGFILSLVKKSKDVLTELFNIAVKHRDDYKALEQLKIFEFIVHTNVDATNLVRQMVEIHIQYVNSSSPLRSKKRVVLLK